MAGDPAQRGRSQGRLEIPDVAVPILATPVFSPFSVFSVLPVVRNGPWRTPRMVRSPNGAVTFASAPAAREETP